MKLLLDSHAAIWIGRGTASPRIRDAYLNPDNQLFLSVASVWEMAIKRSIGKLDLQGDLSVFLERLRDQGVQLVPVGLDHALRVERLPFIHRDPFDRILAATCLTEGWSIVSVDVVFDAYGVVRLF